MLEDETLASNQENMTNQDTLVRNIITQQYWLD